MALGKADEPVHSHPGQGAHEELALGSIRAAYQDHLRVERREVRLRVLQTRIQPQRVLETAAAKRDQRTRHPYDPRKNKGRGPGCPREYNRPPKYKFVMGLADLIAIPNIATRLKAPEKVGDKVLGPKPDAWCEFH